MAGILTSGMKLSYSATSPYSSYTDLTDLLSIPELGGSVSKIDVTTLGDTSKKSINGLKDYGDISFTFLFDKTQFNTLNALTGTIGWKVTLPGNTPVTATFTGSPSVKLSGAGVDARIEYTLSIATDSDIVFA